MQAECGFPPVVIGRIAGRKLEKIVVSELVTAFKTSVQRIDQQTVTCPDTYRLIKNSPGE